MSIIVTKGTLDWAYPPCVLAIAAPAMDVKTTSFSPSMAFANQTGNGLLSSQTKGSIYKFELKKA